MMLNTAVTPPAAADERAGQDDAEPIVTAIAGYAQAVAAADGDGLVDVRARNVRRGMTLWCPDGGGWFVAAAKAVTAPKPGGGRLTEPNKLLTDIPIEPGSGQTSCCWELAPETPLIQRHVRLRNGRS